MRIYGAGRERKPNNPMENIAANVTAETEKTMPILSQLISPTTLVDIAALLVQFLLVIVIVLTVRKVILRMIDSVMNNRLTARLTDSDKLANIEEKRLDTLRKLFKSIVSYVLYFIAILTCLDMVGIKVTTILAGAGILSLAVAFGAQSIVQDLMSGLFIILENQYAVGEYVKIGSTLGKVEEIGMKTTKISTYNGEVMVIPNGKISELVNYSRRPQRANVDVGIAYEEDLDNAMAVLEAACLAVNEQFAQVLSEQAHVLGVMELADSAVTLRLTFTALDWQQAVVERALRKQVKDTLDAQGVEIAYPKLELIASN